MTVDCVDHFGVEDLVVDVGEGEEVAVLFYFVEDAGYVGEDFYV